MTLNWTRRTEWLAVALLTLLAFGLRIWQLDQAVGLKEDRHSLIFLHLFDAIPIAVGIEWLSH